jgi:hypothetical protein
MVQPDDEKSLSQYFRSHNKHPPMAEYVPFSSNVEVLGQTVLSCVNALPSYQNVMEQVLAKHGLADIMPDKWYSQERWLNAFRDIGKRYGPHTLFLIGKAIPLNAKFPPNIDNLETALNSIDIAYKMNHRNGDIGYYKLLDLNHNRKLATMECKNPYPSFFDMGIILSMARKFKSNPSDIVEISRDETQPSRLTGAMSCQYILKWA